MKTILFFDRCDLTRLFILLTKELKGKANIIHVSYSEKESKLLEESGITDYIDYQKELSYQIDNLKPTDDLFKEIDNLIISQSKDLFTLNGSIQSDRGFSLLNYEEALLLACCHYTVWKTIFNNQFVDVMYHEPASQFMTHIAGLLCKAQGGKFIYPTQLLPENSGYSYLDLDGENFTCRDLEEKYHYYSVHTDEIDIDRCKAFLNNFRKDYTVAFSELIKPKTSYWELLLLSFQKKLLCFCKRNEYDRLKNNIDYWILHTNNASDKLYNLKQYKKRNIHFTKPQKGEKYFYYSIHLEPESTVLYLSGGRYTNQVKLIENIAASLPAGYYLYVKDHPHEFAYRKADDYERLMKIPNIRLIDQKIPGKLLIRDAIGVFSIVGTASFEGLLLGKQTYCFGKSYYSISPLVSYIESINDLRATIYNNMKKEYNDSIELYSFVFAYLTSLNDGFVTYFGLDRVLGSGIDEISNAKIIAQNILR